MLVIRETQSKIVIKYHLIPIRLAKIQMFGGIKCSQGPGTMGNLLVGAFIGTMILDNNLATSNKAEDAIICNLAVPL